MSEPLEKLLQNLAEEASQKSLSLETSIDQFDLGMNKIIILTRDRNRAKDALPYSEQEIFIYNLKTGQTELLDHGYSPEWTADGRRIVYFKEDGLYVRGPTKAEKVIDEHAGWDILFCAGSDVIVQLFYGIRNSIRRVSLKDKKEETIADFVATNHKSILYDKCSSVDGQVILRHLDYNSAVGNSITQTYLLDTSTGKITDLYSLLPSRINYCDSWKTNQKLETHQIERLTNFSISPSGLWIASIAGKNIILFKKKRYSSSYRSNKTLQHIDESLQLDSLQGHWSPNEKFIGINSIKYSDRLFTFFNTNSGRIIRSIPIYYEFGIGKGQLSWKPDSSSFVMAQNTGNYDGNLFLYSFHDLGGKWLTGFDTIIDEVKWQPK